MTTEADQLVARYLEELRREARRLPRARRAELVHEIETHIAEARGELENADASAVRTLLDDLGEPAEIAREAADPRPHSRGRSREIVALVLLLAGGVAVPVVGWLVGVVLLWASDRWVTRDKLLGTLVVPGGLLPVVYLTLFAGYTVSCGSRIDPATGRVLEENCVGGPSDTAQALWIAVAVVLLVAPLVTTAYLARRLQRAPA